MTAAEGSGKSFVPAAVTPRGLYVNDEAPGIARVRHGNGFAYRPPDGKPLRDSHELARIRLPRWCGSATTSTRAATARSD